MSNPLIYVDLKYVEKKTGWLGKRYQGWTWVAKSAGNNMPLAKSTERYTNRQDAINAITLLFGINATVYQREAEHGNVLLRMAVPTE